MGNIQKNKFSDMFLPINSPDDSRKIINKKPKVQIFNLSLLNDFCIFDFNISKREIVIKKVTYNGFINLEYSSL